MALTKSVIVANTSAGPMVGEMDWRPPTSGKHSARELREVINREMGVTHYTHFESGERTLYGLCKRYALDDSSAKLPKGAISAAVCFANLVGQQAPNAALVLPVECEPADEAGEQRYLVIVLEDGMPHVDVVVNEIAARDTIGSEERPMWAFNEVKYPNCVVVDFEWLAAGSAKSARLLGLPHNPWPQVTVAVAAGAILLTWWAYDRHQKAEAVRQLAQAQAQADPVPKYLAALNVQAPTAGTRRADLTSHLGDVFSINVAIPGWQLKGVECTAAQQQCVLSWLRKGGTFQDIQAALSGQKLMPVTTQGNEVPALEYANTVMPWVVRRENPLAGTSESTSLPTFEQAMADVTPLLQLWRTAGINVDLKQTALWPAVPGVPAKFVHPSAVRRGQISVAGIPGPFIQEVLESAPRWIHWESINAELGEGDMRGRLNFKATGNYYVSSNEPSN